MATFHKISTIEVGAGNAANIEFTSIPQTYTDLLLNITSRTVDTAAVWYDIEIRPNSATANRKGRILYGSGSGVASQDDTSSIVLRTCSGSATGSVFGVSSILIPNYASSQVKSFSIDDVSEHNGAASYTGINAALWTDTSPITSLKFLAISGNIAQYSVITLYGITKK